MITEVTPRLPSGPYPCEAQNLYNTNFKGPFIVGPRASAARPLVVPLSAGFSGEVNEVRLTHQPATVDHLAPCSAVQARSGPVSAARPPGPGCHAMMARNWASESLRLVFSACQQSLSLAVASERFNAQPGMLPRLPRNLRFKLRLAGHPESSSLAWHATCQVDSSHWSQSFIFLIDEVNAATGVLFSSEAQGRATVTESDHGSRGSRLIQLASQCGHRTVSLQALPPVRPWHCQLRRDEDLLPGAPKRRETVRVATVSGSVINCDRVVAGLLRAAPPGPRLPTGQEPSEAPFRHSAGLRR
eukprot:753456-Hanusia_phi.AAC.1